ncbi:hypothetical protein [Gemmata sp.]|uniref:hypothetical protein n=1 Tax=Gemmata sp. TaxID=1914242 RepID=UPI003F6FE9D3
MSGPPSPAEIIELFPVPRVQLVVAFRIAAGADPVRVAASAVGFAASVLTADRKLRLEVVPGHAPGELRFEFRPAATRSDFPERLKKLAGDVKELGALIEGAELLRAEVVPHV